VIRFYVVSCRCWTAGVEGPFFDVFEVWHFVPTGEILLFFGRIITAHWDPKTLEYSKSVLVDVSCAGDGTFGCILEVNVGWVLLSAFVIGDGFVANDFGNE
jgi:hypothetical protein